MRSKTTAASLAALLAFSVNSAQAEVKNSTKKTADKESIVMDRVMVIGSEAKAKTLPGSATFIGKKTLEKYSYTDINRVLNQVPGVNNIEEDGYGNRPNIGLRGGRSDRSADVTLMEDGVLIAPAPYAASEAYYFPRVARMEAVEVRKGSSTVKFGPRTTNGAVNLISKRVPQKRSGEISAAYGSNETGRAQAVFGDRYGDFSYLLDLGHESTQGFKKIDIVGGNTGYNINDAMGKLKWSNASRADDVFHSLELKLGHTKEESDETYLGLTDADFDANPYRRYASSQKDEMQADHQQYQLRHFMDMEAFDLTTTLYRNDFKRNWYKLNDVIVGGTSRTINSALSNATALSALKGETNLDGSSSNYLKLRANNRDYIAQGVQTDIAKNLQIGEIKHKLEAGVRLHQDKEDRFQHDDRYSINGGVMSLTAADSPGSQSNLESRANAGAFYLTDEIKLNKITFTPGVRYEHIVMTQENFATNSKVENTEDAIVPGIGIGYEFTPEWSGFTGVHKGFAPPRAGAVGDKSEESVNYEAGVRYNKSGLQAEMIGFITDYENLLGRCTSSSGSECDGAAQQFNAGEVVVQGLELASQYNLAPLFSLNDIKLPITANYTYTQTEFKTSFVSAFAEWGTVNKGDELPYIPKHQFFIGIGLEKPEWEINASAKFVDEMRTQAGSGDIPVGQGVDAHMIVDVAGEIDLWQQTRAFVNVDNIFDEEYAASRRPAGLRPGKPRTAIVGVKYKF